MLPEYRKYLQEVSDILKCQKPRLEVDGEPLGFNMAVGLDGGDDESQPGDQSFDHLTTVCKFDKPCGTVGCIAGHILVLEALAEGEQPPNGATVGHIEDLVMRMVGADGEFDTYELSREQSSEALLLRELFFATHRGNRLELYPVESAVVAVDRVLAGVKDRADIWRGLEIIKRSESHERARS